MQIVSYGQQDRDTIVLLHGGGLSWWNFRDAAALLAEDYHVLLPVLDGHGGSDFPFTSIEDNGARILSYIDAHCGGHVLAIGGVSLGGQIAAEILSQRKDICRYALLESTLVTPMKLTHMLIEPVYAMSYGLIRHKWFSKLQFAYLRIKSDLFEEYYRDTCRISKENMISFLKANSAYRIKDTLPQTSAKVLITAGSKELKHIRSSAALLHRLIPHSRLELLKGISHGELSLNHAERYVRMLREWISE